mgnify:CR=1 FL=1
MKQSFYEASIRVDEEFDNAEIAAKSNRPSENASINILDLKLEVSKVKKVMEKHGSEKDIGTKTSATRGKQKDE